MHDDLARVVVGLPVAAVWPLTLPSIAASRLKAGSLAIVSAVYVVWPLLSEGRGIFLVLLATVLTCLLASTTRDIKDAFSHPLPFRPLLGVIVLTILAAATTDWGQAKDALETFVDDDAAALAIS